MRTIAIMTLAVILIFISSCSKQKDCPAFDSSDLEKIPYKIGDSLVFENQEDEIYSIIIKEIDLSTEYTYQCNDIDRVCPCINYVEFVATSSDSNSGYTFLKFEQSDASDVEYYKYRIKDFSFEFDFINELPNIDDFDHIELEQSIEISGTVYQKVIVFSNFEQQSSNIQSVFFNEEFGILQFSEKSPSFVWSRIK